MYKLSSIKQNILIIFFATLLSGCGGGGSSTTSSEATTSTTSTTSTAPTAPSSTTSTTSTAPSSKAIHEGQIKDIISGEGLENVEVNIGSYTTTTDAEGYYTLSDLTETEETVVNFEKEGYLLGSTKIHIKELSGDNTPATNYLQYAIDTYDYQWSYDSQDRALSGSIDIPASVYTDTAGELYAGTVSALLDVLDVTTIEGKTLFPGSFEGRNTHGQITQFVSYGLINLSFKDANGNALHFEDHTIATLTFSAVASLEEENIIPLWYYDYTQGLWIEEGYAERQTDGSYIGEISHPGTWSLNKPIETDPGIYHGHIIDENGSPMSDVRVHAIGENWVSRDLSTDKDGLFELEVIPGKSFQLAAYNYKDKFGATYNVIMPPIASGDIVED